MTQENLSFGYGLVVDSTTTVRQLKRLYLHMYLGLLRLDLGILRRFLEADLSDLFGA